MALDHPPSSLRFTIAPWTQIAPRLSPPPLPASSTRATLAGGSSPSLDEVVVDSHRRAEALHRVGGLTLGRERSENYPLQGTESAMLRRSRAASSVSMAGDRARHPKANAGASTQSDRKSPSQPLAPTTSSILVPRLLPASKLPPTRRPNGSPAARQTSGNPSFKLPGRVDFGPSLVNAFADVSRAGGL